MATVTKSIGSGGGRDYSSIGAWESDLDNVAVYGSGDDAVGECYADSTFDESVQINDGDLTLINSITLKSAEEDIHRGVAGVGPKISPSSATTYVIDCVTAVAITIQDIEIGDITMPSSGDSIVVKVSEANTPNAILRRLLIHDITWPAGAGEGFVFRSYSDVDYLNSFIFAMKNNEDGLYGIYPSSSGSNECYNCSFLSLYAAGGNLYGLFNNGSLIHVKNCISFLDTSGGATTEEDFKPADATTWDYNMSGDTTAVGSNSLISQTASDVFISTVAGSENLHLAIGSNALKAAKNLGGTPAQVNIDIDWKPRAAQWDMGADQRTLSSSSARNRRFQFSVMSMEGLGSMSLVPF
jgi:hypothetical protein